MLEFTDFMHLAGVWAAIHSAQSRVHTMALIHTQIWLSLSRGLLVWPKFSPIYLTVNNMKIDRRTMTQEAKNPSRQCAPTTTELLNPSKVLIKWSSMCKSQVFISFSKAGLKRWWKQQKQGMLRSAACPSKGWKMIHFQGCSTVLLADSSPLITLSWHNKVSFKVLCHSSLKSLQQSS